MKLTGEKNNWYVMPDKPGGNRDSVFQSSAGQQLFGRQITLSSIDGRICIPVQGDLEQVCQVGSYFDLLERMFPIYKD